MVDAAGTVDVTSEKTPRAEIRSRLLPLLFEDLDADRKLTVLDVGPAVSETVSFFAQFRCRLWFADLFEELSHGAELGTAQPPFENLEFASAGRFDICLLWDFLDFLDRDTLQAFNDVIVRCTGIGTLAHAFGRIDPNSEIPHCRYGIGAHDTIVAQRQPPLALPRHAHAQADLRRLLNGFDIRRGTLLPDGRLEILLNRLPA